MALAHLPRNALIADLLILLSFGVMALGIAFAHRGLPVLASGSIVVAGLAILAFGLFLTERAERADEPRRNRPRERKP